MMTSQAELNASLRELRKEAKSIERQLSPEYQYLNLLQDILETGSEYPTFISQDMKERHYKDKPIPDCIGLYGGMMEFDLTKGFPLFTTKTLPFKAILTELLWLLQGSGNIKFLIDNNCHIWDEWGWKKYNSVLDRTGLPGERFNLEEYVLMVKENPEFANEFADLGSIYPVSWRNFAGEGDRKADQIQWAINGLRNDLKTGNRRRHYIVSAWHPCYIYEMALPGESVPLPPCHVVFHFKLTDDGRLNCSLFQRSCDMFLGIPFNVASYSLLTYMIAQVIGAEVGKFVHFLADYHIYTNHIDQCKTQITREPLKFPGLYLDKTVHSIDHFTLDNVGIYNYNHHGSLKGEVALVGGVD